MNVTGKIKKIEMSKKQLKQFFFIEFVTLFLVLFFIIFTLHLLLFCILLLTVAIDCCCFYDACYEHVTYYYIYSYLLFIT